MRRLWVTLVAIPMALVVSAPAPAQVGARVANWDPPVKNISLAEGSTPGSPHALAITGDIDNEIGFVPVTPCRIVDTRGATGTFGAPSLSAGSPRSFPLPAGPCAGIPAGVGAYSLNVTATNTLGPGFFKIFPQGGASPVVSTLNYVAGQTVANAAIVPAGTGGGITVAAGVSGADLIIDINGYYSTSLNPANFFAVVSSFSGGGGVIYGENLDTTSFGNGGHFVTKSPVNGSAGVHASADATSGVTFGVLGETNSTNGGVAGVKGVVIATNPGLLSAGVLGFNQGTDVKGAGVVGEQGGSGDGVYGFAPAGVGVYGETVTGTGVVGITSDTSGSSAGAVWGQSVGATGTVPGVFGETSSTGPHAIGVLGQADPINGGAFSTGVKGNSLATAGNGIGVWGSSTADGVGVYGTAVTSAGGVAIFAGGNFGASGVKTFIDPHPTDANKEIRYVALEGPESGTYFRGRGTFQNGLAVIDVPESFRLVTDPEGLSVQVTPIGAMATVAVLRI
ncbi:MAG TPA: hypothetical protein VKJ00_14275, partial [Thermoanaerobaculia bacterium]|nr:hypothetical protein [Thermoanaerobaculia bacterium]